MSRNSRKKQKTKAEEVKEASQGLRGSIRSELESESDHLTSESAQLIKFHGVYQYDDRDQRRRLLQEGEGKAYRFMVRTRVPGGGRISPEQWLTLDRASQLYGNGTLRLTNRQDIQFHGVGKKNLASLIRLINQELLTTFGACGDGVRNVIACPVSSLAEDSVFDGQAWANAISRSLAFKTTAYMEIWLDGEKIESVFDEPLYGKGYLPRKFKIGISGVNENCPDVYTNDIGLVPVVERGSLTAFEVLVGGGLGSSHGNHQTYPRLATPLCRTDPEQLLPLLRAIVELYRDLGDRTDRKHARLKYVIEEMESRHSGVRSKHSYKPSLSLPALSSFKVEVATWAGNGRRKGASTWDCSSKTAESMIQVRASSRLYVKSWSAFAPRFSSRPIRT
ncbi:MAG TPA: hypothetical protein PLP42_17905 [Acidobacteriota bacterium]|nr:hypothetical protein [Acidobacteriota bacterium]